MPEEDESSHASDDTDPPPDPSDPSESAESDSDDEPPDSEGSRPQGTPGFIPRLNPLADSRLDAIAVRLAGAPPGPWTYDHLEQDQAQALAEGEIARLYAPMAERQLLVNAPQDLADLLADADTWRGVAVVALGKEEALRQFQRYTLAVLLVRDRLEAGQEAGSVTDASGASP